MVEIPQFCISPEGDRRHIEVESGRRLFRAQVYRLKRSCLVLDKVPQDFSLRINPA
jgi:hypothetical protein